ncbi:MAG: hypothetical protein FWD32_02850, partial [Firmicutes bacterium]|nr:hypothetical protein [Bacillota bacterium]
MPTGTLKIITQTADGTQPVPNAFYQVSSKSGEVLYTGYTDANGISEVMQLDTKPKELSLVP